MNIPRLKILLVIFFIPFSLYCNDFRGKTFFATNQIVSFSEDRIEYTFWDNEKDEEVVVYKKYRIANRSNIQYIVFEDISYRDWLIIDLENAILLYNNQTSSPFSIGFTSRQWMEMYFKDIYDDQIQVSSFLIENEKEYNANCLKSFSLGDVWSEGVSGNGIGETVLLSNEHTFADFFIVNGYISYDKPNLFCDNSRMKRIKVITEEGDNYIFDVNDNSTVQHFQLSHRTNKIKIEILDVY